LAKLLALSLLLLNNLKRQLTEALAEQAEDSFSNKPDRPIGKILFDHGWITRDEINFIVLRLFKPKGLMQRIFHST
jgi:chorismate-pyruvate lyase